jgi:hypothetical protein
MLSVGDNCAFYYDWLKLQLDVIGTEIIIGLLNYDHWSRFCFGAYNGNFIVDEIWAFYVLYLKIIHFK